MASRPTLHITTPHPSPPPGRSPPPRCPRRARTPPRARRSRRAPRARLPATRPVAPGVEAVPQHTPGPPPRRPREQVQRGPAVGAPLQGPVGGHVRERPRGLLPGKLLDLAAQGRTPSPRTSRTRPAAIPKARVLRDVRQAPAVKVTEHEAPRRVPAQLHGDPGRARVGRLLVAGVMGQQPPVGRPPQSRRAAGPLQEGERTHSQSSRMMRGRARAGRGRRASRTAAPERNGKGAPWSSEEAARQGTVGRVSSRTE